MILIIGGSVLHTMAKAKTPPKAYFGSSRMSECVFNVIAVSLLDEVDMVPEVVTVVQEQ